MTVLVQAAREAGMHYGDWLAENSTVSSALGAWAFRGFLTLSRHRSAGMSGAEAISYSDLVLWLDQERAAGQEREHIEQLIQIADVTYCNLVASQSSGKGARRGR